MHLDNRNLGKRSFGTNRLRNDGVTPTKLVTESIRSARHFNDLGPAPMDIDSDNVITTSSLRPGEEMNLERWRSSRNWIKSNPLQAQPKLYDELVKEMLEEYEELYKSAHPRKRPRQDVMSEKEGSRVESGLITSLHTEAESTTANQKLKGQKSTNSFEATLPSSSNQMSNDIYPADNKRVESSTTSSISPDSANDIFPSASNHMNNVYSTETRSANSSTASLKLRTSRSKNNFEATSPSSLNRMNNDTNPIETKTVEIRRRPSSSINTSIDTYPADMRTEPSTTSQVLRKPNSTNDIKATHPADKRTEPSTSKGPRKPKSTSDIKPTSPLSNDTHPADARRPVSHIGISRSQSMSQSHTAVSDGAKTRSDITTEGLKLSESVNSQSQIFSSDGTTEAFSPLHNTTNAIPNQEAPKHVYKENGNLNGVRNSAASQQQYDSSSPSLDLKSRMQPRSPDSLTDEASYSTHVAEKVKKPQTKYTYNNDDEAELATSGSAKKELASEKRLDRVSSDEKYYRNIVPSSNAYVPEPLRNIGNTCWVNSAVQFLQPVVKHCSRINSADSVLKLVYLGGNGPEYGKHLHGLFPPRGHKSTDIFDGCRRGEQSDASALVVSILAHLRSKDNDQGCFNFLALLAFRCEWQTDCIGCSERGTTELTHDLITVTNLSSGKPPFATWQDGFPQICRCGGESTLKPRMLDDPPFVVLRIQHVLHSLKNWFGTSQIFETQTSRYELIGYVEHYGYNISSGHYVANVKSGQNAWYLCSDQNISKVSEASLRASSSKVGIMLYRKVANIL